MPQQHVTPEGPDPIDSTDPDELRAEILRLRDLSIGMTSHAEVLGERLADLQTRNEQLDSAVNELNDLNQALHVELGRSPLIRIARAVARRLKLR
ncbi:MAG: hypothetical protein F4Y27_02045 [Acidimicrobiaceae bacterium]|nr:hypothetical protein [Acidimicrobiaceae bacterium]MXW62635.1 hypothetical protein [Acidimicrobiaceae bacterium]MXW74765.1 hypothetical protein [Acidimicrobiaceae bacterium]MYA73450.1 hypothetical protein [Acidimicrobiaceae bacterium]MYC42042.1 hypothetical protein [Acidimicrobiaceae bacterium]